MAKYAVDVKLKADNEYYEVTVFAETKDEAVIKAAKECDLDKYELINVGLTEVLFWNK